MKLFYSSSPLDNPFELSFLDSLLLLIRNYKFLLIMSIGGVCAGYGYSFLLPAIYTAEARIMPPQNEQQMGLAGMMAQLPIMRSSGLGKDPSQLYIGLLKTTVVSDQIIKRFNLKALYHKKTLTETRDVLSKSVIFSSNRDTLISISVNDQNPKRAADIANAYPEELNGLLQSLAVSDAAQRRKFLEIQLQQVKQQLELAEMDFKKLQEKTGVLRLDEQGKVAIDAAGALRAKIAAQEVEIQSLKIFATNENAAVKRAQAELDALQTQLTQLENSSDGHHNDNYNLNMDKLPSAGMEYVRRYRELKFQETMYESIVKQYEVARMEEAKTNQFVQLADPAVIPELRSKPVRRQIAFLFGFAGMVCSIMYIFVRNFIYHYKKIRDGVKSY